MVTKHLQITEDDHEQRAFAIAKATGNQCYPRTTTTTVRESLGSGFDRRSLTKWCHASFWDRIFDGLDDLCRVNALNTDATTTGTM
jgi:hypothetical protein